MTNSSAMVGLCRSPSTVRVQVAVSGVLGLAQRHSRARGQRGQPDQWWQRDGQGAHGRRPLLGHAQLSVDKRGAPVSMFAAREFFPLLCNQGYFFAISAA